MGNCKSCIHNKQESKLVSDNKKTVSYHCLAGNQKILSDFISNNSMLSSGLKNLIEIDCYQKSKAEEIIDNLIDRIDLATEILTKYK